MSLGFGKCMNVFDDLDRTGKLASGLTVLVNDVYHLIVTERGTVATNPDFGFGVTDDLLFGMAESELPAYADEIEVAILEDDRVSDATVEIALVESVLQMTVTVIAATEPPTGFRLVGSPSELRAELIARVT